MLENRRYDDYLDTRWVSWGKRLAPVLKKRSYKTGDLEDLVELTGKSRDDA